MKIAIQSFITGALLGAVFSLINLPIPAPPNLAGVMGVVGIFIGFLIINRIKDNSHSES